MDTYGKWNEEVKKVLVEECVAAGYEPTDPNLIETLTEGKVVYKETTGSHRWWNDELQVIQIGDKFIGFDWANSTGDAGLSDLGWKFCLDTVQFYAPVEVTVTKYLPLPLKGE